MAKCPHQINSRKPSTEYCFLAFPCDLARPRQLMGKRVDGCVRKPSQNQAFRIHANIGLTMSGSQR
jgi:hypothetical protein